MRVSATTGVRVLVTTLTLAFQIVTLARSYILPTLRQIWELRDSPPWYRASVFEGGEDFAGYVSFLRTQIPEDSRVVLPPMLSHYRLDHVGLMQYFLFPREIHNCGRDEVAACTLRASGEKTYILALPDFPAHDLAERTKRLILYGDGLGVFVPVTPASDR